MKTLKKSVPAVALLTSCLALSVPLTVSAGEVDGSIAACLQAWGDDHPFGETPQYKTLGTSVKVFGIGAAPRDTEPTGSPSLVLINPSFNLMGGSTIELMNPNGWYCLRTAVSILGKLSIRAHCNAQLASTSAGATVLGNKGENRNLKDLTVTAISALSVERPCI